MSAKVTGHSTL